MITENSTERTPPNAPGHGLPAIELAGGMKLEAWRKIVGISRTVAWRMRKTGKLAVIVRNGTVFITAETIRNFFTDDGSKPRTFAMKSSPCS
jgi:hypothetical protein